MNLQGNYQQTNDFNNILSRLFEQLPNMRRFQPQLQPQNFTDFISNPAGMMTPNTNQSFGFDPSLLMNPMQNNFVNQMALFRNQMLPTYGYEFQQQNKLLMNNLSQLGYPSVDNSRMMQSTNFLNEQNRIEQIRRQAKPEVICIDDEEENSYKIQKGVNLNLKQNNQTTKNKLKICENKICKMRAQNLHEVDHKNQPHVLHFCTKCMKQYDNDHYCEYCIQIFDPEDSSEIDDKEWIMCEGCERWNHVECEEQKGNTKIQLQKHAIRYYCKTCQIQQLTVTLPLTKKVKKETKAQQKLKPISEYKPKIQVPLEFIRTKKDVLMVYKDNKVQLNIPLYLNEREIQSDINQLRELGSKSTNESDKHASEEPSEEQQSFNSLYHKKVHNIFRHDQITSLVPDKFNSRPRRQCTLKSKAYDVPKNCY